MYFMDKIISLLDKFGPSVLFLVAAIFVAQKLIEHFFKTTLEYKKHELTQEIDIYKANLKYEEESFKHKLNENLEEHKHKLEIIKQEFLIQFSTLHQERNKVIKELYSNLVELHSALLIFTRRIQPIYNDKEKEEQERVDRVAKALNIFIDHYLVNRIFIPEHICEKIDYIIKEYKDKTWDYGFYYNSIKKEHLTKEIYLEYSDKCKEISKTVESKYPPLIDEIEKLFRKLLGDK